MNYVELIKAGQEAGRTGKGRFGTCSGWLAKRRSLRFKAICRLLRVWAKGGRDVRHEKASRNA